MGRKHKGLNRQRASDQLPFAAVLEEETRRAAPREKEADALSWQWVVGLCVWAALDLVSVIVSGWVSYIAFLLFIESGVGFLLWVISRGIIQDARDTALFQSSIRRSAYLIGLSLFVFSLAAYPIMWLLPTSVWGDGIVGSMLGGSDANAALNMRIIFALSAITGGLIAVIVAPHEKLGR